MSATHSVTTRHRNHWMVPLALVTAVVMWRLVPGKCALASAEPRSTRPRPRSRRSKTRSESLKQESKTIDSKAAAIQLAREQYQLVAPGQSLIQVLPENSAGQVTASSADPGFQPLVAPSDAAPLAGSTPHVKASHHAGFVSRLVRTLEFWR